MGNCCNNEITITGSEESVEKALSFILNDKGIVDFSIVCPYPKALEVDFIISNNQTMANGMPENPKKVLSELRDINPNRIGKLALSDFLAAVKAIKEASEAYTFNEVLRVIIPNNDHITQEVYETLEKEMRNSPFFDEQTAVEVSLEKAIYQGILDAGGQVRIWKKGGQIFLSNILSIIRIDYENFCQKEYGYKTFRDWALDNWGVKWNVEWSGEEHSSARNNEAGIIATIFFSTESSEPKSWFYALLGKINEVGLCAEIELSYAEGGSMTGGAIKQDLEHNVIETEYSEDEIREILAIDEDNE